MRGAGHWDCAGLPRRAPYVSPGLQSAGIQADPVEQQLENALKT
jgi:hypothetical protein